MKSCLISKPSTVVKYFQIFYCIFIGKQLWSTFAHFATYCTLDHAEPSWSSIWSVLCESMQWLSVLRQDRTGWDESGKTGQDRMGRNGSGQDRTGWDGSGQDRTGQNGTVQDGRGLQGFQLQWNNCLVLSFDCLRPRIDRLLLQRWSMRSESQ